MANQPPKRFLRGGLATVVFILIYYAVGIPVVKMIWPDSNFGLWVLIAVGLMGGYYFNRGKRGPN